jgi:serine/threonine-protein kinase
MSLIPPGTAISRYTILGKLATGGMSEVYLARQSGPLGFSKIVVLKIILPQFADDDQFVQMFQNEAKLAALLNHPGIVQIFDYGMDQDVQYIAMEYIDGRNLKRILRALQTAGKSLPIPVALRIVSDASSALDYAHHFTDPGGQQLNIIHRDVSLENILVTYSGQVKLVDFGIAKARTMESYTSHGLLKGKYSYMAPEVIEGKPVDHRADIYALGVVLYRLLVGRMPFKGGNHAEILHRVLFESPPAPRSLVPKLSPELEAIILKALHKNREERYQRSAAIQSDIESFLLQNNMAAMPYHMTQFMGALFPPGSDVDRDKYLQFAQAFPATPLSEASSPNSNISDDHSFQEDLQTKEDKPVNFNLGAEKEPAQPTANSSSFDNNASSLPYLSQVSINAYGISSPQFSSITGEASNRYLISALGYPWRKVIIPSVGVIALFTLGWFAFHMTTSSSPSKAKVLDSSSRSIRHPPIAQTKKDPPKIKKDPPVAKHDSSLSSSKPELSVLSVKAPGPADIYLNGKRIGGVPLLKQSHPPGTYRLEVKSQELGYTIWKEFSLSPGEQKLLTLSPRPGKLHILVRPWASVFLDGKKLGDTPLPPMSVIEGQHKLVLTNANLKIKKSLPVIVKPDKLNVVKVWLKK